MCDDLIAHHYYTHAPPHPHAPYTQYAPPPFLSHTASRDTPRNLAAIGAAPFTMFTHHDRPTAPGRLWLILPSAPAWESFYRHPGAVMEWYNTIYCSYGRYTDDHAGAGAGRTARWTVNCYDKRVLSEKLGFETVRGLYAFTLAEHAREIDMLYEMVLPVLDHPTSIPNNPEFTPDTPADAASWYRASHPAEAALYPDPDPDPAGFGVGAPWTNFVVTLRPTPTTGESPPGPDLDRVGFATVLIGPVSAAGKLRCYVSKLFVSEPWRGKGVGGMLMEQVRWRVAMLELGAEVREREVWLTVFTENVAAVGLYFALGYRVHRTLWALSGGGGEEDGRRRWEVVLGGDSTGGGKMGEKTGEKREKGFMEKLWGGLV